MVAIAAGFNHSLALLADGTIRGWGSNASGQLNFPGTGYTAISALRGGPLLTSQPLGQTPIAGNDVTLQAASNDPDATYQWFFNGEAITGANDSSLVLSSIGRQHAGSYSVTATNTSGTTRSQNAQLAIRGRASNRIHRLTQNSITLEVADEAGDPIPPASAPDFRLMVSEILGVWIPSEAHPSHENGRLYFTERIPADAASRFYRIEQD